MAIKKIALHFSPIAFHDSLFLSMLQSESIRYLKGVGPKKEEVFNRIGIYTLDDLLFIFLPLKTNVTSKKKKDIKENEFCVIKAKILARI